MKKKQITNKILHLHRCAILACAGVLIGCTLSSSAAVRTWTGGGNPDFSWSNPANWGGTSPVAGDFIVFDGTVGINNTNDLTAATSFSAITFATNAGAFVLNGNLVKIGANGLGTSTGNGTGGVTNYSSSVQTFYLQAENDRTVHYTIFGGDVVNLNKIWDWRWYKHGPGKLIVANTNTANGLNGNVLGIDGGIMVFNCLPSAGAIGQGLFINPGGTVQVVGPSTNQIASGRDIYMSGGRIQVQTTNALGQAAGEDVSSLKSSSAGATGSIIENGSALGPIYLGIGEGNSRRGYFTGTIQDGAAGALYLRVFGASWQTLAGTNTYSGITLITNGTTSGITRLMMDGIHTGGGAYTVTGNPANSAQQAALGGKGIISASKVDLLDNSFLAPGGTLSSTATNQDTYTATFSESTAVLTFSNAVNLATNTATLDIHLAGATAGSGYDQVLIAGSGTFSNNSANLQLTVDVGYTPAGGEKYTIVQVPGTSAASNIGVFTKLNGVVTDLSQGAIFSVGASNFKISYRAEGSTFDAGAGNGNDIMIQALSSSAADLTWRGDISSDWDVRTTSNWRDTNNASATFTNNDYVTFNDTGVVTNVNLTTDVNPAKLTVNAAQNYWFTGGGKLTGGIVITKTNTGMLTLATDNDNTGAVTVNKGTLQLGDGGAQGSLVCSINVNSNGVLAFNRSDDQAFHPAAFSGTGKFLHTGSGMLTITNDYSSTFAGITTNSGGILQIGDGTALGNSGRLGGTIVAAASSTVQFNFASSAQTIGSSLSGAGNAIFEYGSGAQTITFSSTATNTGFTGTATVKPYTRLEVSTAAATPAGPLVVESDGSGGNGGYYSHVSGLTNQNPITIAGPGPGSPIDTPRGKGALRLGNAWAGPITLSANATIGASAGTGTLLGNISDGGNNYTLEYMGGTIQVGPATGANSYGVTHITEDLSGSASTSGSTIVRALNSNPFSPSVVEMVGQTRLELNGNNVSVANLVDQSSTSAVSNYPPVIWNNSGTAAATLTVGSDNGSQLFGGVFGNGGAQPLGLTKVGAGTFTVTGDSTNSGPLIVSAGTLALAQSTASYPNGQPVLGSGSFSNASAIAIATGAALDVSGRTDGTLTLTSGQLLEHSGAATGPITVIGNVNLGNGKLLFGVDRAGSAHDSLAASGTVTYSGTLVVTNLGAALQAGDSFQLFLSGTTGFTAFNLQTNDTLNNLKYTWNNTVSTDGKVTVASVGPLVNTTPTNIVTSISGNTLTLSWPTDHTGWRLQTNAVGLTTTNAWFDYPGSSGTNQISIGIDQTKTNVFFRMVY